MSTVTTKRIYGPVISSSFHLLRRHVTNSVTLPIRSLSASAADPAAHPWQEWDNFVSKLKAKGYFDGEDGGNSVKHACLKFARERFDILSSLPKQELQAVVEHGCPSLYKKAVSSAKRLREYLKLDEGDVCSACKLRGSCDRAYAFPMAEEHARTVDVMRILMNYAEKPVLLPDGDNSSEHVNESARKLLAELTQLSDTVIDPDLQEPLVQKPRQKEPSQNSKKASISNKSSANIEMKIGDWLCSKCNFLNFARNKRCMQCKAEGPKRVDFSGAEKKPGDWTCPECEFMNYANNKKCKRCEEVRPKKELNPGEWECPECDYVNFRRNQVCKKCDCARPEDDTSSPFDHMMRSSKKSEENKRFTNGDDTDDEDDLDDVMDDILPLREGENNFSARKRAMPAERKFTSARNKTSPWM